MSKKVANSKKCFFCQNDFDEVDYKNVEVLKKFVDYFARIKPRYYTGVCLKHQKKLAVAIKRARHLALLSFVR